MDGSIYGGVLIRPDGQSDCDKYQIGSLTARLATSHEVLRDAWSVRYAAYSSQGYIEPTSSGMFIDQCDYYPSSKTVVIYKNNSAVATVRVCLYAPQSDIEGANAVPAMDVFYNEIVDLFTKFQSNGRPARGLEVMRLARHPDIATEHEPVYALFQMVGYLILHLEADAIISAVRSHHMPFYRRLGFRKVTEPRSYPKLKFLTGLMACTRTDGGDIADSMPILKLLSKQDGVFEDFIAGRPVPVLGAERFPTGLSRLLNNPAEASPEPLPLAGRARGAARAADIRLAA